ncbi:MAG TPA: hypothetical protein VKE93_06600 [Candidatus Angelobacter sp.]|nr:hypothetical protein [Candidatus Angelobacter sp.]
MKLFKLLLALPLAMFLAGCAPVDSLNPLYNDKDVIFDESLLGQWGPASEGLNFAKLGDNGYNIVMSAQDDDTGQTVTLIFEAHLVNLQGHRFLDVVCKQPEGGNEWQPLPELHVRRTVDGMKIEPRLISAGTGKYLELLPGDSNIDEDRLSIRLRPAHQFFKVEMEDQGRTLKLVHLDDSWTDSQIAEGKLAIDHEIMEGRSAVLTASTPDLQQLVLDHVNDEEAFKGDLELRRPETQEK